MTNLKTLAAGAFLALGLLSRPSFAVIFGTDNRIEAQTQTTAFWAQKAKSVAALIPHEFIKLTQNANYRFHGLPLQEELSLCPDARFSEQHLIANCTGSLIGPKHILTAAHCIDEDSSRKRACADYKIVFDYATDDDGKVPKEISPQQVYQCQKVLYRKFDLENFTEDLAIIELDREVSGRTPLELNLTRPEQGTPLVMIGHPLGTPQKFTDDAEISEIRKDEVSFRHNLDTFSVNSGGPVFDAQSGEQIGVLVRGTGANLQPAKNRSCLDWAQAKSDDFAEANDLTPLKNLLNIWN